MPSDEVIVAIALGLPSLIVGVLALWIAYLTFKNSRLIPDHSRPQTPDRTHSWPSPDHWSSTLPSTPSVEYQLPTFPGHVRRRL